MRTETQSRTILYLVRHGATPANLARPPRLQGQRSNPPLAAIGIQQAESARDFLANRPISHCYCSPMLRAIQTAEILATPHGLTPATLEEFTECDIGRWEGMDWQTVRYLEAEAYHQFMSNPAANPYPGGESFSDVYNRVAPKMEKLLRQHQGESFLVVAHHVVNRSYLASLMGLPPERVREVKLQNCGVAVVVCENDTLTVETLDARIDQNQSRAA